MGVTCNCQSVKTKRFIKVCDHRRVSVAFKPNRSHPSTMSIAPEPYHSALMDVLQEAMICTRAWARAGELQAEQVSDLMDSLHNVPHLLSNWEQCDTHFLKNSFVAYDMRWGAKGLKLLDIYNASLTRAEA